VFCFPGNISIKAILWKNYAVFIHYKAINYWVQLGITIYNRTGRWFYRWHTQLWHVNNFTHSVDAGVGQWILILPLHWVWDAITIFTHFVQVKFTFSILNLILNNMDPRRPPNGQTVKNVTKQLGCFDRHIPEKGAEDICRLSHLQDLEQTCTAMRYFKFFSHLPSKWSWNSDLPLLTHNKRL